MTEPTPHPADDSTIEANVELLELRRRIDSLEEEAGSLRRFGILALVVAALACGGAFSAHSSASSASADAKRLGIELSAAKEEIERTKQGPIPSRFLPPRGEAPDEDTPSSPRSDAALARRVSQLEERVGAKPAQASEVEAGLVAWGAETKRYVDEAVSRSSEEQRRLRGEEIARVWERVLDLEARFDGR